MKTQTKDSLLWQSGLVWSLAEIHLSALTDEMCLWEPTQNTWSVRLRADGKWHADFAETEPDPLPTVTIGWLTWQIDWWLTGLLAKLQDNKPLPPDQIYWAGNATAARSRLESLRLEWINQLKHLDDDKLKQPFAYPWTTPQPLVRALAWSNSELMKNVAEIGCLRILYLNKVEPSV